MASDTTVRGEAIAIASQHNEPRFMLLLLLVVEVISSRSVSLLQTERAPISHNSLSPVEIDWAAKAVDK